MDQLKSTLYGSPFMIAFFYLFVGLLWILFSDQLALSLFEDPETLTAVQTYKGWGFVTFSTFILGLLVWKNNNLIGDYINRLEKSRREFETIFEQASVGIAHHSADGTWIRVNQHLCEMLGYTEEELLQLDFRSLIHKDDLEAGDELDKQLIDGVRRTYQVKKRYRRKNGTYFEGLLTKSVAYKNDGTPMYLVANIEEITERKETEKKLKVSLREKEFLLSEVHHRVKNNLALISALFELQSDYTDDKKVLGAIDENKMRIKSLSMIYEYFDEQKENSEINFGEFLTQIVQLISRKYKADQKGIELISDIQDVSMNINQAIPCCLICNELLINAFKHAFDPQELVDENAVIRVSLRENNNTVRLCIADNGCSLPEQVEFSEPSTLGFTIVQALKSQVKGELNVERDNGTSFRLTFQKADIGGPSSSFHKLKLQPAFY